MPIKRCTLPDGKKGYKYGDSGKCYPTRKQALKQMRAIKYSQTHSKKSSLIEEVGKILENRKNVDE